MASKSLAKAQRYFTRVHALRKGDATAKEIRKLADVWSRRGGNTTQGFFKAQAPSVRYNERVDNEVQYGVRVRVYQ